MSTYQEQLEALTAKQAKEREELAQRQEILEALPESLAAYECTVMPYRLWDRTGLIHLRPQRYESLRKGPDPTLDTLCQVWEAFPHEPLAVYRDSCVSVRTMEDATREYNKADARTEGGTSATVTPIAPFWIRIDPSDHEVTFHWIAQIVGKRIEVEITQGYALLQALGQLELRYEYDKYHKPINVVTNCFSPAESIRGLGNARAELIKYGSGSREHPGDHLMYWDSANGECAEVSLLDLLEALQGAKVEATGAK